MTSRAEDYALLLAAVREAGALALSHYKEGLRSWDKRPGDPVSEADLAVDRLLHERLCGARPAYGWLSEESADSAARLGRDRVWVVDPIDGTRAFIQLRPEFCVAAALVEGGAPVLAAIFNPATDEFFDAAAGQGARLNGAPIRTSARQGLAGVRLIGTKRTYEKRDWLKLMPGAEFFHFNSIAYRMALVASGRFDAAVSLGEKSDWDIAAADLLVREAGGAATAQDGAPFVYNRNPPRHPSVIAASVGVHGALIDLLRGV